MKLIFAEMLPLNALNILCDVDSIWKFNMAARANNSF